MKDLLEISCGLDVHKDKIVACILTGPLGKPTNSEIREFTTLIPDMIALRDWIVSQNCHHVAMESTGIYWMPIYEILEEAFGGDITLLVVNARHMKNVPGKKTDMRDSEWISTLLRAGLLNGSFIPLARKLLVIIYTMLKQGTLFDESCFEARRKSCEQKQLSRYIRELEKHGYHVEAQA